VDPSLQLVLIVGFGQNPHVPECGRNNVPSVARDESKGNAGLSKRLGKFIHMSTAEIGIEQRSIELAISHCSKGFWKVSDRSKDSAACVRHAVSDCHSHERFILDNKDDRLMSDLH
jgi:hypothetical protein